MVRHPRTMAISRIEHVKLPGIKMPALLIEGQVDDENFAECAAQVPVKVQGRAGAGGGWVTLKTDTTNRRGVFKIMIRDVTGEYRATATRFQIVDPAGNVTHICQRAADLRPHRHYE